VLRGRIRAGLYSIQIVMSMKCHYKTCVCAQMCMCICICMGLQLLCRNGFTLGGVHGQQSHRDARYVPLTVWLTLQSKTQSCTHLL